ncbi:hypothetical protein IQ260_07450 [Leptolyngbya cf. ectocarpi LEGE 11479]|uniref:Uncharacterized protein n=1 Tax=Leptolyngbya cf. ectocarpi LEGE 11479 TaxID=1828722 RepID=A0A928X252_LEPEC|nr:hypothetical protein [Leptolyngbya ectocarpi]MBE9066485.1 hypothetical protein [Leptolyngbya cf. ectocarpi LEGE 11479]
MARRLWLFGLGAVAMVGLPYQAEANLSSESAAVSDTPAIAQETPRIVRQQQFEEYRQVIEKTQSMIHDQSSQTLADRWGLDILDVTWEDTGRYDNSAVGPNISDMTIQVQQQDPDTGEYSLHLMPVIRYPNFADITGDVPIDQLYVLTGNEQGDDLQRVSLKDVLGDLRSYLSEPDSWQGSEKSLLADRDSHVLVSAQAAFLPIPQGDEAMFNPVLFNYQSYSGDPAVLTLLVTREGTSATIIDNQRDGFDAGRTWGQRLFFNQAGERASLTGQRLSDFQVGSSPSTPSTDSSDATTEDDAGLNMVMLIQVPLKQKQPFVSDAPYAAAVMEAADAEFSPLERSNVEAAVIGHGEVEGPFTEIDNLEIERDPDFPIRVTVQFYKATSNGVVSAEDMGEIHAQIQQVYNDADYVGSLVLDGRQDRPTEYDGDHTEPDDWWERFWEHSRNRLDLSEEEARDLWERLRGE